MYGYKSGETSGPCIGFYQKTGVTICRLRYGDLIREAVESGIFPKSYKSKFEYNLQFAPMPRDGVGREIFKKYKERLPSPPRDLRSEFDRYYINWLIAAGKVSQKSGLALMDFMGDMYDKFDFDEETLLFQSSCFTEENLFDDAEPRENINYIKRPEYRSLIIGIKDSCELIGAKFDKEAFDLACNELTNVNRPKFAMGAFLFDEYVQHENPPQDIRCQLDSVIIDSMIDRLSEFNVIFKNVNFDTLKLRIIREVEAHSVIDGKFVKNSNNQFSYEKSKKIANLFPDHNFHTGKSESKAVRKKSPGQCPFCLSNDTKRISQIIDEGVSSSIGVGVTSSGSVGLGIGFSKTALAKKSQKLKTIQFNESRNGYNKRQAEQMLVSALLAAGLLFLMLYMLQDRMHSPATAFVAMLVLWGVTYFSMPVLFERYSNIDYLGEHYVSEVKIDFWLCLRCGKHWDENK